MGSGKNNIGIEQYLKTGADELSKTISKITQGSKVDRLKRGLQELVSKDTAIKAAACGAAGAAVAIPVPIIGPVTGFILGAGAYGYLKVRGVYNSSKKDNYSIK